MMDRVQALLAVIIAVSMLSVIPSCEELKGKAIAAIEDQGCNTHIGIPAPKNDTNATNYNIEGFE